MKLTKIWESAMQERDIFFYVSKALDNSGAKSERALCSLLGKSPILITQWRRGALPTDETMEKLARIAGIDPQLALIDLNIWRSTGPARAAYEALLQKIKAVALIIFTASLLHSPPVYAEGKTLHNVRDTVYYVK